MAKTKDSGKLKLSKELIQQIKELKTEGAPMLVIAKETKLSHATLYSYFKDAHEMAEAVQNGTFDFSSIPMKKKAYYFHLAELYKALGEAERAFQKNLLNNFRAMTEGEADEQISDSANS